MLAFRSPQRNLLRTSWRHRHFRMGHIGCKHRLCLLPELVAATDMPVHTWSGYGSQSFCCASVRCRNIAGSSQRYVHLVNWAEMPWLIFAGSLVMNWQLFDALGIFLGFTANLAVSSVGRSDTASTAKKSSLTQLQAKQHGVGRSPPLSCHLSSFSHAYTVARNRLAFLCSITDTARLSRSSSGFVATQYSPRRSFSTCTIRWILSTVRQPPRRDGMWQTTT